MEKFRTVPNCHNKRLVILSVVIISGAYCIISSRKDIFAQNTNIGQYVLALYDDN